MRYKVAFSNGSDRDVEARSVDEVIRAIDGDFKRNMVVGITGPRGGRARFYMKRGDGDTAWPISASTAATFASMG